MTSRDRAPGRVFSRSPAATALLPRFLEHRRRDLVTIGAALARGDFETIRRIGHNMSGNGLSYGFPELGAIGERLEAGADAENASAVRERLASLETFLARVDDVDPGEAGRKTGER